MVLNSALSLKGTIIEQVLASLHLIEGLKVELAEASIDLARVSAASPFFWALSQPNSRSAVTAARPRGDPL